MLFSEQQACRFCQVGRAHVYVLLSSSCAKYPRVWLLLLLKSLALVGAWDGLRRLCTTDWDVLGFSGAFDGRNKLNGTCLGVWYKDFLVRLNKWAHWSKEWYIKRLTIGIPFFYYGQNGNDYLSTRGFELYLVICCVYKHNILVVCINMGAGKKVGDSLAKQNANS